MKLIHKNPFRILGLSIDASEREIQKRISDLEIYLEIGKKVSYDTDFPVISPIERTPDSVHEAANAIETAESRFFHSIFWFWEQTTADELALDVLKDGNVEKALQLLETGHSDNSSRKLYYSNVKNSTIIFLALASQNGELDFHKLAKALQRAKKVFAPDHLLKYQKKISDNNITIDHKKVVNSFVDEIVQVYQRYRKKSSDISLPEFLSLFKPFSEETRRHAYTHFTSAHTHAIEDAIRSAEMECKKSPQDADKTGSGLREVSRNHLSRLKSILTKHDFQYQSLADKLAEVITNCSVAYYNYHLENDTGIDPGESALQLARFADSIAIGLKVKQRLEKGIPVIEEYVKSKPLREKREKVESDVNAIISELDKVHDLTTLDFNMAVNLPVIAQNLINRSNPHLANIMGVDYDLYLEWSSIVVNVALSACIKYANQTSDMSKIIKIMHAMSDMGKNAQTAQRYDENLKIISRNLEAAQRSSGSGCYIATMVYGSYNAPEVFVLRDYRDKVLVHSAFGRLFIKTYYRFAPLAVEKLGRFQHVHTCIRYLLNYLVRRLA